MEVKLQKSWPVAATPEQAWAVLSDVRATAACMPGAAITEEVDATHYKGTVKAKVGPASMQFAGQIEVQALEEATRSMQMVGKGADKSGSAVQMTLAATVESGAEPGTCLLGGTATVLVSGKLAQFGSRLLVPVSDAMLAQFADNFRAAAAAQPVASVVPMAAATATPEAAPARDRPVAPPVKELNALALMWQVFKSWLAGVFGRRTA